MTPRFTCFLLGTTATASGILHLGAGALGGTTAPPTHTIPAVLAGATLMALTRPRTKEHHMTVQPLTGPQLESLAALGDAPSSASHLTAAEVYQARLGRELTPQERKTAGRNASDPLNALVARGLVDVDRADTARATARYHINTRGLAALTAFRGADTTRLQQALAYYREDPTELNLKDALDMLPTATERVEFMNLTREHRRAR